MELVVIGNGPSRKLYEPSTLYDRVVACNFADVECDIRVFMDAFAARFMRPREKYHHWLERDEEIWYGERCANFLRAVSAHPGGKQNLADYFFERGHHTLLYPEEFREKQNYFNSGQAGFHIGCTQYKPFNVYLFGFDSLFTGDHRASYTNIDLRSVGESSLEINNEKSESAISWHRNWEKLFKRHTQPEGIYFYGYSETTVFTFSDPRVHIIKVPG